MSSRPILKHFPRLDTSHKQLASHPYTPSSPLSPTTASFSSSSSISSSSTSPSSPSSSSAPSPTTPSTLTILPFASCSSAHLLQTPHVHFPPTPRLISSTHLAHSPSTYDRAPIVVQPNTCALPERGGRIYVCTPHPHSTSNSPSSPSCSPSCSPSTTTTTSTSSSSSSTRRRSESKPKGSYFHPRAYEACEREREVEFPDTTTPTTSFSLSSDIGHIPPALTPDLSPPSTSSSSESESGYSSSDNNTSPPPDTPQSPLTLDNLSIAIAIAGHNTHTHTPSNLSYPLTQTQRAQELDNALASLLQSNMTVTVNGHLRKGKKPRNRERERERERGRERGREGEREGGWERDSSVRRCTFADIDEVSLDGCLGGF